jgi:hypothetical protein
MRLSPISALVNIFGLFSSLFTIDRIILSKSGKGAPRVWGAMGQIPMSGKKGE